MRRLLMGAVLLVAVVGPVAASGPYGQGALCQQVTLQVGQALDLRLTEDAGSTGYEWTCAWSPRACLKLVSDKYVAPLPAAGVGAPGTRTFTWQALAAGDCVLQIQSAQPWKGGGADTPESVQVLIAGTGGAGAAAVSLTETNFRVDKVLPAGASVTVSLPETPSTGYTWKTWWNPVDALKKTGDQYVPPANPLPGAAGVRTWVFKTGSAGRVAVFFQSGQSWKGGQQELPRLMVLDITAAG
jgi:predicted secreted protein